MVLRWATSYNLSMRSRIEVHDLQLVESVARHGSVGAAAKELLTTQPSASRRLAALEARLGMVLFDRDTTGARVTAAGRELARHASRLLSELDRLPEYLLSASSAPTLSIGTIQSLNPMVFTALEIELDAVTIVPEVDHGPNLLQMVRRSVLDAAVITIAGQTEIPRGLARHHVGESPFVLVVPAGVEPPAKRSRRPFGGQTVLYNTIDLAGESVRERLAALGAQPRAGTTIEATLRVARHRKWLALVPGIVAGWYGETSDQVVRSPVPGKVSVSLVTRRPPPQELVDVLPGLRQHLFGTGCFLMGGADVT